MPFYAGKSAACTISASARPADEWDFDQKAEIVDTSNFTSSGWQSNVAGMFSVDANFAGPYDGSEGYAAGDAVTPTFDVGGGGPTFAIPLRLSSVKVNTKARNAVARIAASGTSTGSVSITI